jgi:tetratricopeptide (TPR) repeat protein
MTPAAYGRLKRLFHEVVDLDAARREERLAQFATDDPEIAAELVALLAEHDRTGEFLEPAGISFQMEIPERVANYWIERELGAGGSSRVFLAAREDDEFHRPVALKLLYAYAADRDFGRRLLLERRALAQLDHPNIAHLLDWGQSAEGAPFLAMEYVDGLPVDEYCRERQCDIPGRLRLFLQICDAVEHAHRNLVVHRDIKPANVFVKEDGTVKLLDFGIAKLLSADDAVTVTAASRLTPAYASPEQVRGGAITTASDVYSLGVLLYELLTGASPYRLSTRSVEEMSRAVLDQEPQCPSLAPDLANIALKALRKEPGRRYASVDQMAADIRRYLDGRPVLATAGSRMYVIERFIGRNRVAVALGSLAICALIVSAVVTTWKWRAAEENLRIAEMRYGALRGFAHTILSGLNQPSSPTQTETSRLISQVTVDYLDQLGRERVPDDQLQMDMATAYTKLGDVEGIDAGPNQGNTGAALEDYRKAHSILLAQWRAHGDAAHGVAVVFSFVRTGTLMSDPRQAAGYLAGAVPIASELLTRYPGDFDILNPCAILFESCGKRYWKSGDLTGAIESFGRAGDLARRALAQRPADPKSLQTAAAENGLLCRMHTLMGDFAQAMNEGLESQRLGVELLAIKRTPKTRRDTAINSLFLCQTRREMGDLSGASACIAETLGQLSNIAKEDPANAQAQWDLAEAYTEKGQLLAARRLRADALLGFRMSLRLIKEQSAKDPFKNGGLRAYGASLIRVGEILAASPAGMVEATALFDEAVDVCSRARVLAPSDAHAVASLARAYRGKAEVASRGRDSSEALPALKQSVSLWREARKLCPLDIDLRSSASEAEQALARLDP